MSENLKIGTVVTIESEVEYVLNSSETGSITLVVQGASGESIANEYFTIKKGSSSIHISAEFTVPDTRAIQIYTPLTSQGKNETNIVESSIFNTLK